MNMRLEEEAQGWWTVERLPEYGTIGVTSNAPELYAGELDLRPERSLHKVLETLPTPTTAALAIFRGRTTLK